MIPGLGEPADAVRADGGIVHIRAVADTDAGGLHSLVDNASDRSIYLRFFTATRPPAHHYLDSVIATPASARRAVVAIVAEQIVGLAGYSTLTPTSAEVGLLIADTHQHLGIGTLLIEDLAALARHDHVTEFVAEVLSENHAVINVLRDLGYRVEVRSTGPETEIICHLSEVARAERAVTAREREATVQSLRPLLAPRTVAVVGATERARSAGRTVLESLTGAGFRGTIYPINPNRSTVLGRPCYPRVSALRTPLDLAIIAVPAAAVLDAVRECGRSGVRGIVVLSSGFREVGDDGAVLEAEVVAVAREHGMRVIGPNCLGIVNTDDAVRLVATPARLSPIPGPVGLAAQSGALGLAVTANLAAHGVGISQFVSLGNKADVSGNDLLDWWWADPSTTVVGLYLESFGNPKRFRRIAGELTRHKPVLAIKSGRSGAGQRAGRSHTAAAASPDDVVDALCEQAGVARVRTLAEFVDAARLMATQPLPRGPRLAIVGNSGGLDVLAADAGEIGGLTVPMLSPDAAGALRAVAPHAVAVHNPVDLGAGMTAADLSTSLAVVLATGGVDSICVVVTPTSAISAAEIVDALSRLDQPDQPIVAAVLGATGPVDPRPVVPVFDYPEAALAALATAWQCSRARGEDLTVAPRPVGIDLATARSVLARNGASEWLDGADCDELLRAYGIPTVSTTVSSGPELLVAAERLPEFGPAIVLAAGGTTTELVADRNVRLAPLSPHDVATMTDRLRCRAIFGGYGGAEPVSRDALHDLIVRVSTLMTDCAEVSELDLNPIRCAGDVLTVVAARVRLGRPAVAAFDRALVAPSIASSRPHRP